MQTNEKVSWSVNGCSYLFTMILTNETFQTISLILSIITSLVLLFYRIWKWWKEAKKDGIITKEEINEGVNIIVDSTEEISKKAKNKKEADKDNEKV